MMEMVSGWEWLILMGALVVSLAIAIVVTLVKEARDK